MLKVYFFLGVLFTANIKSNIKTCEQLKRNCYMCELDPRYVDVIIDRWENLTGEKAKLIEE